MSINKTPTSRKRGSTNTENQHQVQSEEIKSEIMEGDNNTVLLNRVEQLGKDFKEVSQTIFEEGKNRIEKNEAKLKDLSSSLEVFKNDLEKIMPLNQEDFQNRLKSLEETVWNRTLSMDHPLIISIQEQIFNKVGETSVSINEFRSKIDSDIQNEEFMKQYLAELNSKISKCISTMDHPIIKKTQELIIDNVRKKFVSTEDFQSKTNSDIRNQDDMCNRLETLEEKIHTVTQTLDSLESDMTAVKERLADKDREETASSSSSSVADVHLGKTLFRAAQDGRIKDVRDLLRAGACVDVVRRGGSTALHVAAARGHADVLEMLLESGANVGVSNVGGLTPLHVAAQEGHAACVRALLRAGASQDVKTKAGLTPLQLALKWGSHETADVLRLAGSSNN